MSHRAQNHDLWIEGGDLGADLTSDVLDTRDYSQLAVQITFTGTPVGEFVFQGSVDGSTWVDIELSPAPEATGAAGGILVEFTALTLPFMRLFYDRTSGTGSVDVDAFGKGF